MFGLLPFQLEWKLHSGIAILMKDFQFFSIRTKIGRYEYNVGSGGPVSWTFFILALSSVKYKKICRGVSEYGSFMKLSAVLQISTLVVINNKLPFSHRNFNGEIWTFAILWWRPWTVHNATRVPKCNQNTRMMQSLFQSYLRFQPGCLVLEIYIP